MGKYVVGILRNGFGMTFRYIDFHDENNGIQKFMRSPFSLTWQRIVAAMR